MAIAYHSLLFFAGSLMGSFFYTLALRYSDKSIQNNPVKALFSRSHCPECGKAVSPVHLVPIVSYIILRGKCHYCRKTIPLAYPLFEILYGLIALLTAKIVQFTPGNLTTFNIFYLINIYLLTAITIVIVVVDIKSMTIPNSLVLAFILLSVFPVLLTPPYIDHLYGFLLMLGVFAGIMFIFPGGFGGGDLKFAPAIGLLLGFQQSIIALEIALISGALTGVTYAILTRKGLRIKIPFAPFLCLGLLVAAVFGDHIMLFYYKLFY